MKKQVLTFTGLLLFAVSSFAQFTAAQIWSINRSVDPMPHNSINFSFFTLTNLTYSSTGVPLTAASVTQPGLPLPKFRITSTVAGNSIVCISAEQEDNDPWEEKERATFLNDGTIDTSIIVEESSNGSPFEFRQKITYQQGVNTNQYTYLRYNWINAGEWKLSTKNFYYLSNGQLDSVVQYNYTNLTDSSKVGYQLFYYSTGLDSTLAWDKDPITNQYVLDDKTVVEQKENGKTKVFSLFDFNNGTWSKTATFTYSNGPASFIGENNIEDQISIYPNPTTESISISSNNQLPVESISILNMNGQLLKQVSNVSMLDIQDLTTGLYFIQITTNKGTYTQKFTKQ